MLRWIRLALGLLVLVVLAIGGALAVTIALTPPPPAEPTLAGRFTPGRTAHGGRARTWLVYEPARLQRPTPVVFLLPGSGQDAATLRLFTAWRFDELAERDGVLLVYAEAWAEGGVMGPEWNECRKNTPQPAHHENVDDVGFLLWLLGEIGARYAIDPARVYAAGVSDGGQMAYRLATEHPERFDAVAIVVAQQAAPENSNCLAPRGPISVLVMNGTEDPIIPYEGGIASFHGFCSPTARSSSRFATGRSRPRTRSASSSTSRSRWRRGSAAPWSSAPSTAHSAEPGADC
jgi:polyhydroxybutyrate depolymerase